MNPTQRFIPKSWPLGRPVAGLQVLVHRSCWLLLPLLLISPPLLVPSGPFAYLALTVTLLVVMGGAVFAQVAAQVFLACRLGAAPSNVLLFPFGPVLTDGVDALTVRRRLVVWLAGPLVSLLGGSLLMAVHVPLLDAGGGWLHAYGIFSLTSCYPLAGGLIVRELLCLTGSSATDADRRTLEVSRVSLCVLGALALLNISLPWLYALFVLWIVGHLALMPGVDLAGVRAASLRWFQDRWSCLRRRLGCGANFAVLAAILWSRNVEPVYAADKPEPQQVQIGAALQAALQRVRSLESNDFALAARLAHLERRLDETTAHVAAAKSAQCGADRNISRLTARLAAVATALDDETQRCKAETAASMERLSLNHERLATSQSQLPPRILACEAAIAQLRQQTQRLEQQGEILSRSLEAARVEADRALALHDQKIGRVLRPVTGLTLFGLAALGLAVGYLHYRIQRLALGTKNVQGEDSFAFSSPIPVTTSILPTRPESSSEPEFRPLGNDQLPVNSARSVITPESYALQASGSGSRACSCSPVVPVQLRASILGKPIPEPAELLRRMILLAQRSKCIRAKPSPGRAAPWTIGCVSSKGSVRPKNEDYALAFEIAGCQIVLVADGVSGEPLAGPAAYLAIQSAAWSVIRQLGAARPWRRLDPAAVASRALWRAAKGLARIATACRCATGLKTTLIVVVSARRAYGYAYIGDGKGCILRATGIEEDFLMSQRAPTDATCVLAACLGPTMLGGPITGTIPRQPGDLLIVGTDGAFSESVELGGNFTKRLLRAAFHFEGDLQRTVSHVLQELSSTKDELGFLFDDNLSLVLAGDGKPPRLSPGFWLASGLPKRQEERGGKGAGEAESLLPPAALASARELNQP